MFINIQIVEDPQTLKAIQRIANAVESIAKTLLDSTDDTQLNILTQDVKAQTDALQGSLPLRDSSPNPPLK